MKRALVVVLLSWISLWPLVHRGLAAAYHINPWKLSGFAMYSAPVPPVLVAAFRSADRGLVPIDEGSLSPGVRSAFDGFRVRRHALGRFVRPDEIGFGVLEERGDLEWVMVSVQRMTLGLEHARMESDKDTYLYERPDRVTWVRGAKD